MLPNFDIHSFPYCVAKARRGVTLLNLQSLKSYDLVRTDEMQGNSYFQKLTCKFKRVSTPGGATEGRLLPDLVVTHVEWKENKTIVEQVELPELFIRALSLNGVIQ